MSQATKIKRRDKAATHGKLLQAAARVFNKSGFDGTDSNRLARAAGYAPGTFYQHFSDKRDCFLQVYEGWVAEEWTRLERVLESGGSPDKLARGVVEVVLAMHRDWRGLRAGLRALVAADETVRKFQRAQRKRQLGLLEAFRTRHHTAARSRAEDTLLLLAMERAADALADGEIDALEVSESSLKSALHKLVLSHLKR
jgi:AcrR family transcriptional regulator